MKILILGSNGMLGSMLTFLGQKQGKSITSISKAEFNVLNDQLLKLDDYPGDIVINCIGAIPQKKYTEDEYKKINIMFPQELSIYCKSKNKKLIHISTNCVFSGKKDNCTENDTPDALDIYGKSKYLGEPDYGLILRCSVIGPEKQSCFGLMEWFLNTPSIHVDGFVDSYWNGLTTLELSKVIFEIIENKKIENKVLHYYSEITVTKFQILSYLKGLFQKNIEINKRENGTKYYTLSSVYTKPRKDIFQQLIEINKLYCLFSKMI